MNRWLARLSFSFFVVAAVLVWEIYQSVQGRRGDVSPYRIGLYTAAAVILFALGFAGVRARHRHHQSDR